MGHRDGLWTPNSDRQAMSSNCDGPWARIAMGHGLELRWAMAMHSIELRCGAIFGAVGGDFGAAPGRTGGIAQSDDLWARMAMGYGFEWRWAMSARTLT